MQGGYITGGVGVPFVTVSENNTSGGAPPTAYSIVVYNPPSSTGVSDAIAIAYCLAPAS